MCVLQYFSKTRPRLTEFLTSFNSVGKVELDRDLSFDTLASALSPTQTVWCTIKKPIRISEFSDLPPVDSLALAHCCWQTNIYCDNAEIASSVESAMTDVVMSYGGGLYSPTHQSLLLPEKAELCYGSDGAYPPWEKLHRAFEFDGNIRQIEMQFEGKQDWEELIELLSSQGYTIMPAQLEGLNCYRDKSSFSFSEISEILDSGHTPSYLIKTNCLELKLYVNELTNLRIDVDPSQIIVYRDAISLLQLMEALATGYLRDVHLKCMGAPEVILTINRNMLCIFHE